MLVIQRNILFNASQSDPIQAPLQANTGCFIRWNFFWETSDRISKAKTIGTPAYGEDFDSHLIQSFIYNGRNFVESLKKIFNFQE